MSKNRKGKQRIGGTDMQDSRPILVSPELGVLKWILVGVYNYKWQNYIIMS